MAKLNRSPIITDLARLHEVSMEVDMSDMQLVQGLEKALLDAYNYHNGKMQGLAAIQVDKPYKAILLRFVKGEEPIICYNPIIKFKLGSKKSNEGCMSEGDQRYIVKRPTLMLFEYQTKDGTRVKKWLSFMQARIVSHECDHLKGILLQDYGKKV